MWLSLKQYQQNNKSCQTPIYNSSSYQTYRGIYKKNTESWFRSETSQYCITSRFSMSKGIFKHNLSLESFAKIYFFINDLKKSHILICL